MSRNKKASPHLTAWLWGIAAATLLFALLFALAGFSYIGSDDQPILRSFMGYEGGSPAHYHLYLHTFLAWSLHGLALLAPGVAWFSVLQLFLLWFSCAVLVKSLAQSAKQRGLPAWAGALAGIALLAAFALYILCRVSYTTTGALLGSAAVAQLMSIDYQKGTNSQILRGMLLSVALLLSCYSLRQIGALPPLAFWTLAIFFLYMLHFSPRAQKDKAAPRSPKPLLLGVLVCALSFGLFAGVRAMEIKSLHLEDYLKWQTARIQLFDYTAFDENTDPATLEALGWSPEKFKLVSNWFFMDESITAEAFEALYAAQMENVDTSVGTRAAAAVQTLKGFFAVNPAYLPACGLLLLLCAATALAFLFQKESSQWLALAPVAGGLLGVALLLYLSYQGRLPMRAAASAILPTAAFLFGLLPYAPRPPLRPRSKTAAVLAPLCAACLLLTAVTTAQTLPLLNPLVDPDDKLRQESIPVDLDAFALDNPDMLIIYDLSMIGDLRMFPDTSQGIPGNLMFWGGYPARSPSWLYQLEQYGVDGNAMTAQDFLRENVLVASSDGQPWESLVGHVQQEAEGEADWDFYDEYGYIGFFQFYEY